MGVMRIDLAGQTLGKYRVVRSIGEGGMGVVYEARHETLDQRAAIKVLASRFTEDADLVRRFVREGRFLARLRHERIVAIYDLGLHDGSPYLVMEFAEGRPLVDWIERKGAFEPVRALHIARQIADALGAAHAESIVHRDIKPDNVMLDRSGRVKVMDFGIAKQLDSDLKLTMDGAAIGTLMYMSPEQCRAIALDHRSDLYSLGVVLFVMLTGEFPYAPELASHELMDLIVDGKMPSARERDSQITAAVDEILRKLTATDRDDRYQSAADVADDIRHCIRVNAYTPRPQRSKAATNSDIATADTVIENFLMPRKSTARRRADRELAAEVKSLHKLLEQNDGRHRHRRQAIRRQCRGSVYVDCWHLDEMSGREPLAAEVLDLSPGGVAALIPHRLEKGSLHVLELGWDEVRTLQTTAEIRWTRHIEQREGYATGFKFKDLSDSQRGMLRDFLEEASQSAGL